jgi:ribosomal protein S18 acetylase RimI-like enzyme
VEIRLATISDAPVVLTLMRALYEHEDIPFDIERARSALERMLRTSALGEAFVMREQDSVAGYFVLTFGYSLEFGGRTAVLDELFVQEQFRRRGFGRAALDFCNDLCRKHGMQALHLLVERKNERAQAVYRSAGFTSHDRDVMTKWL